MRLENLTKEVQWMVESKAEFLNLVTTDTWGHDSSLWGAVLCIVGCLASSLASNPLDGSRILPSLGVTTKHVSRHHEGLPKDKIYPSQEPLV